MYAVICSPQFWKEIEQTIVTDKGEQILIKAIDTDVDIASEFERINRIAIRHLIIDITSIQDHNVLIRHIKRYRTVKDTTQIIIIAPNCLPGNPIIHQLVTMGIYDIIAPREDNVEAISFKPLILESLEIPATYKRAVKWIIDDMNVINQSSQEIVQSKSRVEREPVEQRTVTITKEKIVGTVVIGVAGTMKRIGTTHTAIAIAEFLKNSNFRVAVLELHNNDNFETISNAYEDVKKNKEYFELDGIDFYPYTENLNVLDILQENYNYLVLDMGIYQNCDLTEFKRSNARILVSGVKDWELINLDLILRAGDTIYKNLYYFNFSDKHTFDIVQENMDQCKCFQAPYNPNPFSITKECTIMFKDLLKDVIPEVKQANTSKNSGLLKGIFKK